VLVHEAIDPPVVPSRRASRWKTRGNRCGRRCSHPKRETAACGEGEGGVRFGNKGLQRGQNGARKGSKRGWKRAREGLERGPTERVVHRASLASTRKDRKGAREGLERTREGLERGPRQGLYTVYGTSLASASVSRYDRRGPPALNSSSACVSSCSVRSPDRSVSRKSNTLRSSWGRWWHSGGGRGGGLDRPW